MSEHTVSEVPQRLIPADLCRICTEEEITHATACRDRSMLDDMFVGADQKRFADALALGMDDASKSHIFIAGISGPRALAAVKEYITRQLTSRDANAADPPDLCCLHNFDNPLEPIIVTMPKGKGKVLQERMEKLLAQLKMGIPGILVHDEVLAPQQKINIEFHLWWEAERLKIIQEAKKQGILIVFQGDQALVNPISRKQKKIKADYDMPTQDDAGAQDSSAFMRPEELDMLPPHEREMLLAARSEWIQKLTLTFVERDRRSREAGEKIADINRKAVSEIVEAVFEKAHITSSKYGSSYSSYIEHVKRYAVENMEMFNPDYSKNHPEENPGHAFLPWCVNLLVDNSEQASVPVIADYNATFADLIGRIERIGTGEGFYTDHTMISAGSVACANHGYLIVDALNILRNSNFFFNTGSYPALKRIISTGILTIEDIASFAGGGSPIPMRPMSTPVDLKVIMVGPLQLWNELVHYDPEFLDHFELKAEVTPIVERTGAEIAALASSLRQYGALNNLAKFDASALGKLVEYAGRLADSKHKLSTNFNRLESIAHEASYCARVDQSPTISAVHMRRALDNKFYRSSFLQERMQQMIRDKEIILPLKGDAVGQVTILGVYNFGDTAFGLPARITADWSVGRPGFVSIHREAGLAGEILKKGELTVQGYLQALFAKRHPLAVNITYTEEQSYSKVDGDSASLALLYAILSALSDIPLRQDIAITGSMPQRGGHAQAIGGVNEKIEGFFDVCALTGLTGTQGVIIPESNVNDLMLNYRVIEAVEEGTFAIWAISDVKEGIRILMGREAGDRNADFTFTEGSVYDVVDKRLLQIMRNARDFSEGRDPDFI